MKMEQTDCSKTLTYKIQTSDPEENIQHTEHGESLRSRTRRGKKKKILIICHLQLYIPGQQYVSGMGNEMLHTKHVAYTWSTL
jgi:hypothetical protein